MLIMVNAQIRFTKNRIVTNRPLDLIEQKEFPIKAADLVFDNLITISNAPKDVSISMEPKEGDFLVYHPTPGFNFYDAPLAQLSVLACIYNKGASPVDLDKVTIEYKKGSQMITKNIMLPSDQLKVDPNYIWCWQNGRPYHENGDVVFLEAPFPSQATFRFYFKDYTAPIVINKKLKPYAQAFVLPFKATDLKKDEFWSGYSMHGGGDQVYAYDLGVTGYNSGWSDLMPGQDGTQNAHFRIWGKAIYAMADGYVLESLNNCPNNAGPISAATEAEFNQKMEQQKKDYWGPFESQGGGAGNHLCIRHGNLVALYAHLKNGSISNKLLTKGATVKKGDFLGYAGNSGNSTAPHLHVQVKTYKDDNTPGGEFFRPLIFTNGFVIGRDNYPSPNSNVAWTSLDKEGVPGLKGKACFIWPGHTHPYCAYPGNGVEVSRHGIAESSFQTEFNKIWTCGYYPVWIDGYDAGGKTYFNIIFRPSKNVQWVAKHNMNGNTYQSEFNKWTQQGYRIINVDSYLSLGQVKYAAVWVKDGGSQPLAYHGATLASHEANFKPNIAKGLVPVNVSCVTVGGNIYVTAIWEKKNTGGFYLRPAMTLQQYKDNFNEYTNKQGFKLVYLNGYTKNGQPMLSGIWYRNAPNYSAWWAKHHLSAATYQSEYTTQLGNGFLTRCVTGYADGGMQRFEGIWSK